MCDEREQLIEYVYGESAPADRRQIEAHLVECHVCRAEVSGIRGVRDDLLAWDVPPHEPVWRPFAAVPVRIERSRLPVWSLALAAAAVFTAGLAGGMAVRGWDPGEAPAMLAAAAGSGGQLTGETSGLQAAPATAEDLERLEAALLIRLRAEMDERLRMASVQTGEGAAPVTQARDAITRVSADQVQALSRRLAAVESWRDDQISLNAVFNGQFGRLNSRTSSLSDQLEFSQMQRIGLEIEGGR